MHELSKLIYKSSELSWGLESTKVFREKKETQYLKSQGSESKSPNQATRRENRETTPTNRRGEYKLLPDEQRNAFVASLEADKARWFKLIEHRNIATSASRVNKTVAYKGPVTDEHYSIPLETIPVFTKLQQAFQIRGNVCMLYGPRQFGKTTIAHGICDWISQIPGVMVVYVSINDTLISSEQTFWTEIAGKLMIDGPVTNSMEVLEYVRKSGKKLFLVLDEFDRIKQNPHFATNFLNDLCDFKRNANVHGFLGVGSWDLINLFMHGGDSFNIAECYSPQPFSMAQMERFFETIDEHFPRHVIHHICDLSSGAPGVFGSLVRFCIDSGSIAYSAKDWIHWFPQVLSTYFDKYNPMFHQIVEDIAKLDDDDERVFLK